MKSGTFVAAIFLALTFVVVIPVAAQMVNRESTPACVVAKTCKLLTGAERKVQEDFVKNGGLRAARAAQAQESGKSSTVTNPLVAIRVVGDPDKGVYADATSTGTIPSGSILVGVRISPTGTEEFLYAYQFFEDVEPGWFWANMELGKRAAYTESGGKQRYEAWHLRGGQNVYPAEIDFNNPSETDRAAMIIKDGFSYYENGLLKMKIVGNFSGNVGIVLKEANGWVEYVVPSNAIQLGNGFVQINVSVFPDYEPRLGDYIVTVVDGSKMSDSYRVRINRPPASGSNKSDGGRPY